MNQEYKEKLSRKIENNFSTLEERIMGDIVRRIQKTGKITSTADWQINRLLLLGNSSEDIERMLKEALDASYPEMFELYDKVIDWEYVRNKDIYEQVNQRFIPYEENDRLQMLTQGYIRQTKGELENITQSLGFYLDYGNGRKVLTPLAQIYQGYLDNAVLDIASGAFDYNSVLRRTVTQLTNSGLRTIDYASGRSYRVNVAARMAVMTGIKQLSGKIADMNAEKLGTDYFEVDWHMGARPDHQAWQGRVYSREELESVCGLGTVTGLEGANCYHSRLPFFPGISVRAWPDEWLDEMNRKENTPKEFQGKEYTVYEAKQKQRRMETAMRAQREKVKLLQAGGADPDEVMLARCKYQGQLDEYARFSKKMGLKQEREWIYLDMQGRIAPSKASYIVAINKQKLIENAVKSFAKPIKGDIIKIKAESGSAKYRELRQQAIIKKGISQKRPIFSDDTFGSFASRIPAKPGYYDVALHGAPKTANFFGERISADTLAEIIKSRPDYDGRSSIRLLSCSTGQGENCFAQRLSSKLGVPVEAPDDIIWARSDGTFTIGKSKYKNTGHMITFYP